MAPLEVISAGMSRTGTKSLQTALNMLGYNTLHFRCFHQDESLDMDGLKDAIKNCEEADWDKLYENYNAAVDVPTWLWYKNLIRKYPNAKVILTVRDPESWYTSMKNFISIRTDPKNRVGWGRPLQISTLLKSFSQSPDSPLN